MKEKNLINITVKGHLALMLVVSLRSLLILKEISKIDFIDKKKQEIIDWYVVHFNFIIKWLEGDFIDGEAYYKAYLREQVAYYGGYFYKYTKGDDAFNACYCTVYYLCFNLFISSGYKKENLPSSIKEVDLDIVLRCLDFSQQASNNPEAEKEWQEKVIAHLLQDHYTDNPEEFGENITREYIEELLGEKLPF